MIILLEIRQAEFTLATRVYWTYFVMVLLCFFKRFYTDVEDKPLLTADVSVCFRAANVMTDCDLLALFPMFLL